MEIGEIIGIYVAYGFLTNARLGFGGTSPTFYRVKKLGKIFDKFVIGGLLFHNWGNMENLKQDSLLTIFTPNFVGVG